MFTEPARYFPKSAKKLRESNCFNIKAFDDDQSIARNFNLKNSRARLAQFYKSIEGLPRPPDVVCIQDPPLEFAYAHKRKYKISGYERFYTVEGKQEELHITKRTLGPEDCPERREYRGKNERRVVEHRQSGDQAGPLDREDKSIRLGKVAFLIHSSVAKWWIEIGEGGNETLAARLFLETATHTIIYHNAYNHLNKLNWISFFDGVKSGHFYVNCFMMDSNLWHPDWSVVSDGRTPTPEAEKFVQLLRDHEMVCINTPGQITFSRTDPTSNPDTDQSVIDLICVSEEHAPHAVFKILDTFNSDHRVLEVTLPATIERINETRYVWELVDVEAFRESVKKDFEQRLQEPLGDTSTWYKIVTNDDGVERNIFQDWFTQDKAEEILEIVNQIFIDNIDEHVPITKRNEPPRPLRPNRRTTASDPSTGSSVEVEKTPEFGAFAEDSNTDGTSTLKSRTYATLEGTPGSNAWRIHRYHQRACDPQMTRRMPTLTGDGNIPIIDNDRKKMALLAAKYPLDGYHLRLPDENNSKARVLFPEGFFDSNTDDFEFKLSPKRIEQLIKDAAHGKSSGPLNIPIEPLKFCKNVVSKYLAPLFLRFLQLGYYPPTFKKASLVPILKQGEAQQNAD